MFCWSNGLNWVFVVVVVVNTKVSSVLCCSPRISRSTNCCVTMKRCSGLNRKSSCHYRAWACLWSTTPTARRFPILESQGALLILLKSKLHVCFIWYLFSWKFCHFTVIVSQLSVNKWRTSSHLFSHAIKTIKMREEGKTAMFNIYLTFYLRFIYSRPYETEPALFFSLVSLSALLQFGS